MPLSRFTCCRFPREEQQAGTLRETLVRPSLFSPASLRNHLFTHASGNLLWLQLNNNRGF
jgi:hypothetical protein